MQISCAMLGIAALHPAYGARHSSESWNPAHLSKHSGVAGQQGFVRCAGYLSSTGFQRSLE
jgi:hypothetical protein